MAAVLYADSKANKQKDKDSPSYWATHWSAEFQAAEPQMAKFIKAGEKIDKLYLMENGIRDDRYNDEQTGLFHSNVQTIMDMMYGQLPKADVDRSFADANDDTARVAAEISERMLNQDIQNPGNNYGDIIRSALQDRILPGLGCARVRYDYRSRIESSSGTPDIIHPDTGEVLIAGTPDLEYEVMEDEWVDTIYTHWKDILWSPARTHGEITWKAFRNYMSADELQNRFGGKEAKWKINIDAIPMKSKGPMQNQGLSTSYTDDKQTTPQAEVWEVWCLKSKEVFWFVKGFPMILDRVEDPLELEQFFPDPPPMIANTTTSKYIPKSDYSMAQDLYIAIDVLQNRISRLTEACKLVGVYDKANDEIKRVFNEGVENQLIPVDNWAMFAEKGGIEGVIDWLPIEEIAGVIEQLTNQQQKKVQQLYEITGMSDILRGASQQSYTSAAETQAKTNFGSIRLQRLQNDLALWVSNLQSLKLEIICKHFQPQTIMAQSNIMQTPDAQLAQQAIEFMQHNQTFKFRVKVQPESMALADYQQMKQDRTDFIAAMSQFMQSAAPLAEMDQDITPFLLQLLQWGLAGFKGSQQIEGVMDQAVRAYQLKSQQSQGQPKPDPKMDQIKAEGQLKLQLLQAQGQQDAASTQAKQQMEYQRAQADHQAYMNNLQMQQQLAEQKFQNEMEILKAQLMVALAKVNAQQQADMSNTATDMIQHAEQTKMDAASDTHAMITGAAQESAKAQNAIAISDHQTANQKEAASHAAKIQAKSQDSGNGTD